MSRTPQVIGTTVLRYSKNSTVMHWLLPVRGIFFIGTDAAWLCVLPARPKAFAAGCCGVAFTAEVALPAQSLSLQTAVHTPLSS